MGKFFMQIGEKIKFLRMQNNLTQSELAKQLNVSSQAVSNWERQKGYPDIGNLITLSDKFELSLDELIKEDIDFKERLLEKKVENKLDLYMNCLFLLLGSLGIVYEFTWYLLREKEVSIFILAVSFFMIIDGVLFLKKRTKKLQSINQKGELAKKWR